MLNLILDAIADMMAVFDWDVGDFKYAMGITDQRRIKIKFTDRLPGGKGADELGRADTDVDGSPILWLDGDVSRLRTEGKSIVVHELAHIWDAAHDHGYTIGMAERSGSVDANGNWDPSPGSASDYGKTSPAEDWAEAVAACVYPQLGRFGHLEGDFMGIGGRKLFNLSKSRAYYVFAAGALARYGRGPDTVNKFYDATYKP
jgi:hypothetical protein